MTRLAHTPNTLAVGVCSALFFGALLILSNVFANETTTWWTSAIFAGFALTGLYVFAAWVKERHDIGDTGMTHRPVLGGPRSFEWTDVQVVSYSHDMGWFRLELTDRNAVRVSALMRPLPEFAQLVLRHARNAYIDPDTGHVLRETASGNLPPVWRVKKSAR